MAVSHERTAANPKNTPPTTVFDNVYHDPYGVLVLVYVCSLKMGLKAGLLIHYPHNFHTKL